MLSLDYFLVSVSLSSPTWTWAWAGSQMYRCINVSDRGSFVVAAGGGWE